MAGKGAAHSGSSHVGGEFLDLVIGAQVYWRDFGSFPAVGKKELSGKQPWRVESVQGLGDPSSLSSTIPNPLGDLGWALLLWPSVSSCGM